MAEITELLNSERVEAEKLAEMTPDVTIKRVSCRTLDTFKRDTNLENILLEGRWAVRGGLSMHVSTTGSGKSVLQTQSALCFNRGLPCCGLKPVRPFKTWIIQSEDDEDRVAMDRDDIIAMLAEKYPKEDWSAASRETKFLDFTGLTGVSFIETLDNELKHDKPDAVIINPFNAYFGGDQNSGRDVSAFLKGGELGRRETEGLEAVLKRHMVWGWIFAHTGKPPTASDLKSWMNDPFGCAYKACGSSNLPDAVRSIMTFLKVPESDWRFVFSAGKNGHGLGWRDYENQHTIRTFFRWGDEGRHYWQDVDESEWPELLSRLETLKKASRRYEKSPQPPPRDETPIVLSVFARYGQVVRKGVARDDVQAAINTERRKVRPVVGDIGRDETSRLLESLNARGVIRILPTGTKSVNGCMCGLPEVVEAYLNPPLIEIPEELQKPRVPGSKEFEEEHDLGGRLTPKMQRSRSRKGCKKRK